VAEQHEKEKKKVLLICSRNTLDGVYPPLILGLQGVRAGAETAIFFTFNGLDVIRKGGVKKIKYFMPGLLGAVPGVPALATRMMLGMAEKKANVPPPAELLEMARLEGVKLYGCLMTMQMMGVTRDDLIEGAEVTDAAGYMRMALDADVQLFI